MREKGRGNISPPQSFVKVGAYGLFGVIDTRQRSAEYPGGHTSYTSLYMWVVCLCLTVVGPRQRSTEHAGGCTSNPSLCLLLH